MFRNGASVAVGWYRGRPRVSIGFVRDRGTNRDLVRGRWCLLSHHHGSGGRGSVQVTTPKDVVICPLRLCVAPPCAPPCVPPWPFELSPAKGKGRQCRLGGVGSFADQSASQQILPGPVSADVILRESRWSLVENHKHRKRVTRMYRLRHQLVVTLQLQIWLQHSRYQESYE